MIEDEECVGQALTLLLEQHGYRVVRCFDALEGIERLRAGTKPDLILLDLVTPRMDGWEFRVAQRREPAWADIPVVALSADGSAKALAIDVAAFLRKPVEGAELLATLDQVSPARQEGVARRAGEVALGPHDELANPVYFALDCLAAAREHGHRLDNELAGLSRARSIALGRLLESAHRSVEALAGALSATSPFFPKLAAADAVDLRGLLDLALELVGPELPSGTRVKRGFMPAPAVHGDAVELGQVFLNLLRNAARALRGQPSPEVAIELFPDAREQVFVTISDNGCGVPAGLEEQLFEPFCTTSRARAAGLGLTVVRQLIERQGGRIEYESIEGLGSSFVVSLRAQPRGHQKASAPESHAERKLLGLIVKHPQLAG
ncbi:MAG TPA: sensor histidine kinase, partial [Polyangiaceae bacterium]|nr:sensor histidine kinase [Polyangiaceae bacterium]